MGSDSSIKTAQRLIKLMQLIPRGRKLTAKELRDGLAKAGGDVSTRTVQRDLRELQTIFQEHLISDDGKPTGWRWAKDAPSELVLMDEDMAVVLNLVLRYIEQVLPRSTLKALAPLQVQSKIALSGATEHWNSKVLIKRSGPDRDAPKVNAVVHQVVFEALWKGELLDISYKKRNAKAAEKRRILPRGLMLKNDFLYLIAQLAEDGESGKRGDDRQYALHRISSVQRCADVPVGIPSFSLEEADRKGRFNVAKGHPESDYLPIRLVLRVHPAAAINLIESPLKGMRGDPETLEDGYVRIVADVPRTEELVSWLRGYGKFAVVEEPTDLRERLRQDAAEMLSAYTV